MVSVSEHGAWQDDLWISNGKHLEGSVSTEHMPPRGAATQTGQTQGISNSMMGYGCKAMTENLAEMGEINEVKGETRGQGGL